MGAGAAAIAIDKLGGDGRQQIGLAHEIGDVLKHNAGILKLAESMQVIYRPDASADFGESIGGALSAVGQA